MPPVSLSFESYVKVAHSKAQQAYHYLSGQFENYVKVAHSKAVE